MNNSGMFRIQLDDYALPGYCSGGKYYFGTLQQIGEWIAAIGTDRDLAPKMEHLTRAYHAFCEGNCEVTHPVAYREVPFLERAEVLHRERIRMSRYEWKHFNVWGFPYYLRCDGFDTTHLWLKCGEAYTRHVIAEIRNLQYGNTVGDWTPLGSMYWGFPKILVEENGVTRNRLAEWEKTFKSHADADEDWRSFRFLKDPDFCELFNDIFGDG